MTRGLQRPAQLFYPSERPNYLSVVTFHSGHPKQLTVLDPETSPRMLPLPLAIALQGTRKTATKRALRALSMTNKGALDGRGHTFLISPCPLHPYKTNLRSRPRGLQLNNRYRRRPSLNLAQTVGSHRKRVAVAPYGNQMFCSSMYRTGLKFSDLVASLDIFTAPIQKYFQRAQRAISE